MSEQINGHQVFSLLEVTRSIEKTLSVRYKSAFWVKAEMNKLNHYTHSGHAYPDLVEKRDGKVVAQLRGNIWKSRFEQIDRKFREITREPLKDGINIMFRAEIKFHPEYGLALNILDIEPSYTLGELEREKQETLRRLAEENIINRNKELPLPLLPQRIAIISVETSKGYADFMKVIENNNWGYHFFTMLFPAVLQGDGAVSGIKKQLERIRRVQHHFDMVAIIRGGGGDVGLSSYNNYDLAHAVALFPLPVLTGIGHSTNETVVEMIAKRNTITPTKLAEFLIQQFHNFSVPVKDAQRIVTDFTRLILQEKNKEIADKSRYFLLATRNLLTGSQSGFNQLSNRFIRRAGSFLQQAKELFSNQLNRLEKGTGQLTQQARMALSEKRNTLRLMPAGILKNNTDTLQQLVILLAGTAGRFTENAAVRLAEQEKQVQLLDPANVLERGYSITYLNGRALHGSTDVKPGDTLETQLHNGKLKSIVKSTNLTSWQRTRKHLKNFSK
jgi:exodeoxyribonuclease VII large subunit